MAERERIFGIDLEPRPASEASLPLTDLTLRRGYGAFDFLRVESGVPLFLDDHLVRLERSAERLGLTPRPSTSAWREHVLDLIERNGAGSFGLQLYLTGGDPADGFTPGRPRALALVVDPPHYADALYEDGVKLLAMAFQRDLPEAKTTNYFTAVRHAVALREAGATDLLYHDGGRMLETTRCNVFVATSSGGWATPERGVLPGITRMHLIETLGGAVEERDVTLEELFSAPEAVLTSTTKGVMPIVEVDGHVIGEGTPGPLGRAAAAAFADHREAWMEAFRSNA